jgi:hypothetical protein
MNNKNNETLIDIEFLVKTSIYNVFITVPRHYRADITARDSTAPTIPRGDITASDFTARDVTASCHYRARHYRA